jgi:hypothetical protein
MEKVRYIVKRSKTSIRATCNEYWDQLQKKCFNYVFCKIILPNIGVMSSFPTFLKKFYSQQGYMPLPTHDHNATPLREEIWRNKQSFRSFQISPQKTLINDAMAFLVYYLWRNFRPQLIDTGCIVPHCHGYIGHG